MNGSELEVLRQAQLAVVQELRPIDDTFMSVVFNNTPCVNLLIQTILDNKNLEVDTIKTQHEMKNLLGRSVRLDIFARDGENIYNIEVQRDDRGASPKRARYNSALMDMNVLPANTSVEELPINYVIFITENDICGYEKGCGQALYKIERTVTNLNGKPLFNDQTHIIYVNGSYRGDDPIGRLMSDFFQSDPNKMYNQTLADRVRQIKETKEGQDKMCDAVRKYALDYEVKPAVNEAVNTRNKKFAEKLWNKGYRDYDEISELTDLPVEEVQKLFEGKST